MHITNHKNMSCFDEKQLFFCNTESDFSIGISDHSDIPGKKILPPQYSSRLSIDKLFNTMYCFYGSKNSLFDTSIFREISLR